MRLVFPKLITALGRKLVPVTVRITVPSPMMPLVGEIDVIVGTGFVTLSGRLFETIWPVATVIA